MATLRPAGDSDPLRQDMSRCVPSISSCIIDSWQNCPVPVHERSYIGLVSLEGLGSEGRAMRIYGCNISCVRMRNDSPKKSLQDGWFHVSRAWKSQQHDESRRVKVKPSHVSAGRESLMLLNNIALALYWFARYCSILLNFSFSTLTCLSIVSGYFGRTSKPSAIGSADARSPLQRSSIRRERDARCLSNSRMHSSRPRTARVTVVGLSGVVTGPRKGGGSCAVCPGPRSQCWTTHLK